MQGGSIRRLIISPKKTTAFFYWAKLSRNRTIMSTLLRYMTVHELNNTKDKPHLRRGIGLRRSCIRFCGHSGVNFLILLILF